jgi:hypothetical protein
MKMKMEKNKEYYLVKESVYFYDGHSEAESGLTELSIKTDSKYAKYSKLDESKTYNDDFEVLEDGYDEDFYPEDGYHCSSTEITFKKIKESEVKKYKKIIKDYNDLLDLI